MIARIHLVILCLRCRMDGFDCQEICWEGIKVTEIAQNEKNHLVLTSLSSSDHNI